MTFYDAHRVPLRFLYRMLMRVRCEGTQHMPAQGGVVVVSNHLTMLDPWLLGIVFNRQLHFMAKEELFRFAPTKYWLHHAGSFPVRRGEVDRVALRKAEELLRAGKVVMIFPEGHRSGSLGAQEARAGAAMLAARTGSAILPVAIAGTEQFRLRALPGQSMFRFLSWPRVLVRVGEPIMLANSRGPARKAAADLVMRRIVELLPPAYHGVYATEDAGAIPERRTDSRTS